MLGLSILILFGNFGVLIYYLITPAIKYFTTRAKYDISNG